MTDLLRREPTTMQPADLFDRFDRMIGEWLRAGPTRSPAAVTREGRPAELVRVDEFYENGDLIIRAELPGIDPDADVELTVSDGLLHIQAQRREEEEVEGRDYLRRELRYGAFARSLALPEGVTEDDVTAAYRDGILEVRIPAPTPTPTKRIEVAKA